MMDDYAYQAGRGPGLARGEPSGPRPLHPDVRVLAEPGVGLVGHSPQGPAPNESQAISRGSFRSLRELNAEIRTYTRPGTTAPTLRLDQDPRKDLQERRRL